jgi:hypothetical protein
MSIIKIQEELKAPKNQRNNFGNYNYRSAEDIIEAVKPIAHKYGYYLNISDEIVEVGGRIYVKATARLYTPDAVGFSATGWAREEETKKGMDASQITGAASSYARKYALNGLLAIDDTKDSDATNTHGKETPSFGERPWLNEGTEEFKKVKKALTEGKATIDDARKKFNISAKVADLLTK